MRSTNLRWRAWQLAALMIAIASASFAQAAPAAGAFDVQTVVQELGLPKDKSEAATKVLGDFVAQIQEASKSLIGLLSQKKPEQLLDPQLSTRIAQLQKSFSLKFEKFQLDFSETVGQDKAIGVIARIKGSVPKILLDSPALAAAPATAKPAELPLGSAPLGLPGAKSPNLDLSMPSDPSGSSGPGAMESGMMGAESKMMGMMDDDAEMMKMMSGMSGMMSSMMGMMAGMEDDKMPMSNDSAQMGKDPMGMGMGGMPAAAPQMPGMAPVQGGASGMNMELLKQVQATSALMSQMLPTLASKTDGAAQAQLQLLGQMMATQAATLQALLGASAASPAPAMPAGSMPAAGMNMGNM